MVLAAFAAWAALGLGAAQSYWAGLPPPSCPHTYVAVIFGLGERNNIAAGQYIDPGGNCMIWLDANQNRDGRVICKRVVHEEGHLRGLGHSTDPLSVMYSPFNYRPMPFRCKGATRRRNAPAHTSRLVAAAAQARAGPAPGQPADR